MFSRAAFSFPPTGRYWKEVNKVGRPARRPPEAGLREGKKAQGVDNFFQWAPLEVLSGGAAPRSHLTPQRILGGGASVWRWRTGR